MLVEKNSSVTLVTDQPLFEVYLEAKVPGKPNDILDASNIVKVGKFTMTMNETTRRFSFEKSSIRIIDGLLCCSLSRPSVISETGDGCDSITVTDAAATEKINDIEIVIYNDPGTAYVVPSQLKEITFEFFNPHTSTSVTDEICSDFEFDRENKIKERTLIMHEKFAELFPIFPANSVIISEENFSEIHEVNGILIVKEGYMFTANELIAISVVKYVTELRKLPLDFFDICPTQLPNEVLRCKKLGVIMIDRFSVANDNSDDYKLLEVVWKVAGEMITDASGYWKFKRIIINKLPDQVKLDDLEHLDILSGLVFTANYACRTPAELEQTINETFNAVYTLMRHLLYGLSIHALWLKLP